MGKGDKRTKRGKIFIGSYGVLRRKKKKQDKFISKNIDSKIKKEKTLSIIETMTNENEIKKIVFGIVAEGVTDFAVIENILDGYFQKSDTEISYRHLQPNEDATDETSFGSWYKVLEYCGNKKLLDVFEDSFSDIDYLIIQIDTDKCEDKNYDVLRRDENGKVFSPLELTEKVQDKLKNLISNAISEKSKEDKLKRNVNSIYQKVIFAVSVDSIECWLLPLHSKSNKDKTVNCRDTLLREINKKSFRLNKEYKDYQKASIEYSKHKELLKNYPLNSSLQKFVENLNDKFDLLRK